METIKLDTLQNIKSSTIQSSITIEDYVTQVKNGYQLNQINTARSSGKGNRLYTKIKENRKAVLFNFNFTYKRRNENISRQTNLLYYDIDDSSFDIDSIDTNNFYIIHKSFGGKGYTLIVKVENINYESHSSFKKDYMSIANQLGIGNYIDQSAIKMTQPTILSYDNNIQVNPNSVVLYPINSEKIKVKKGIILPTKRVIKKHRQYDTFFEKNFNLKYETVLESYSEDCVFIKEGKEFVECKLPFHKDGSPRKLKEGERRKWLSVFCNNLLYINGYIQKEKLYSILSSINKKYCIVEVPNEQLYAIISYKLELLKKGELIPYNPRLKKYWTNPLVKQKRKAYDKKRKNLTEDKLIHFFSDDILNINKKITQKLIAEYTGLSLITIKRKFKENPDYKEIVKEINRKL